MYKKIIIKSALLIILLIAIGFIYKHCFFEQDIQKYSDVIDSVRNVPNDANIIYVGESSNITFRADDIDKRPISAFLAEHFPTLNVYNITKSAAHAGIYKILLENLSPDNKVKTVIVTLNLRSFNAQWIYSDLETPLQKSMVLLKDYPPIFNRFLLSFKAYDIKNENERKAQIHRKWKRDILKFPYHFKFKNVIEWDGWMYHNGFKNKNGQVDSALTVLACHFIKGYAFQIDTLTNPRIKDLNVIVALAKKRGWRLVFNLMAENTQKAKELVGDDLIYLINQNTNLLINYYQNKGVKVINNLNEIEDEEFVDQNWTTEHYAEKGRKKIAYKVANSIKQWYPNDYVDVTYNDTYQTEFFNDCDKGIIWGQTQTYTKEIAYSGKQSSVTNSTYNFSITFEYPLKIIPDSLKNEVNIDFRYYQQSLNHNAKLVVEASGKTFSYFWYGMDLKPEMKDVNRWLYCKKSFIIPDSIRNADIVKIYVYNPSNTNIYIDDLHIKFK